MRCSECRRKRLRELEMSCRKIFPRQKASSAGQEQLPIWNDYSERPKTGNERVPSRLASFAESGDLTVATDLDRKSMASVASLYDWSTDRDRPMPTIASGRLPSGSHLGRQTSRLPRPKTLTKGEKGIIKGICSNRGIDGETVAGTSAIVSHTDAWYFAKSSKNTMSTLQDGLADEWGQLHDDGHTEYELQSHYQECRVCFNQGKYYCSDCGALTARILPQELYPDTKFDIPAPPSSPVEGNNNDDDKNPLNSKHVIPPINSANGATYVKRIHQRNHKHPSQTSTKTTMNVFLPNVDTNTGHYSPVIVEEQTDVFDETKRSNYGDRPITDDDCPFCPSEAQRSAEHPQYLGNRWHQKIHPKLVNYKKSGDPRMLSPASIDWETYALLGIRPKMPQQYHTMSGSTNKKVTLSNEMRIKQMPVEKPYTIKYQNGNAADGRGDTANKEGRNKREDIEANDITNDNSSGGSSSQNSARESRKTGDKMTLALFKQAKRRSVPQENGSQKPLKFGETLKARTFDMGVPVHSLSKSRASTCPT